MRKQTFGCPGSERGALPYTLAWSLKAQGQFLLATEKVSVGLGDLEAQGMAGGWSLLRNPVGTKWSDGLAPIFPQWLL